MVPAPPWWVLSDSQPLPRARGRSPESDERSDPVHDAAAPTRPPLLRLALAQVGVCAAGVGVAGWLAVQRGGDFDLGLLTLGATLPGVAAALLLLASRPAQPAGAWAVPVLAGSMVRALLTLAIAVGMTQAAPLDKPVFLLTVLGVLLACLVIEVGTVLNLINSRGAAGTGASLEGARS